MACTWPCRKKEKGEHSFFVCMAHCMAVFLSMLRGPTPPNHLTALAQGTQVLFTETGHMSLIYSSLQRLQLAFGGETSSLLSCFSPFYLLINIWISKFFGEKCLFQGVGRCVINLNQRGTHCAIGSQTGQQNRDRNISVGDQRLLAKHLDHINHTHVFAELKQANPL